MGPNGAAPGPSRDRTMEDTRVTSPGSEPVIVPPGTGTALDFLSVSHVLTSRDTGGGHYLFQSEVEPRAGHRPPAAGTAGPARVPRKPARLR